MNNINNRYKKYYDKVSPDPALVKDTKEKMLAELRWNDEKEKIHISALNKYMVLAACVAITATSLLLIPKLNNNVPVSEQEVTDVSGTQPMVTTEQSASKQSDNVIITAKDTIASVSTVPKQTAEMIITATETERNKTTTAVPHKTSAVADASYVAATEKIRETAEGQQTAAESVQQPVVTEPIQTPSERTEATAPVYTDKIHETVKVPEVTAPVVTTSGVNLKPGGQQSSTEGSASMTQIQAEAPLFETVTVGENTINLNYSFDFIRSMPFESISVDNKDALSYFGKEFLPASLAYDYPDVSGIVYKYDTSFDSGINYIFGEESSLYKKGLPFVSISVGKNVPEYGYDFLSEAPVSTEINGTAYYFGKLLKTNCEIYYCEFSKNDISYQICFKGYDIEDAMKIILGV